MRCVSRHGMRRGCEKGRNLKSGQWLEGYVLLLLSREPAHGYDLTKSLGEFDVEFNGIGQMGTLYRILRQMEAKKIVVSEWDTTGVGAPRRVYKITAEGKNYLHLYVRDLKDTRARINKFIEMYSKIEHKE